MFNWFLSLCLSLSVYLLFLLILFYFKNEIKNGGRYFIGDSTMRLKIIERGKKKRISFGRSDLTWSRLVFLDGSSCRSLFYFFKSENGISFFSFSLTASSSSSSFNTLLSSSSSLLPSSSLSFNDDDRNEKITERGRRGWRQNSTSNARHNGCWLCAWKLNDPAPNSIFLAIRSFP